VLDTWPWSRRLADSASGGEARDHDQTRHSAPAPAGNRAWPPADGESIRHSHMRRCRAGRRAPVRGRLPLTGGVLIAEPIEDSAARLAARASAVSTGSPVLDRLLAGPASWTPRPSGDQLPVRAAGLGSRRMAGCWPPVGQEH